MSAVWYYSQNDQQIGPVTGEQLKQLAASGQLTPETLVWKDGMAEWVSASRVKGLFASAPVATAAPAQPVAGGYAEAQPAYGAGAQGAYGGAQPQGGTTIGYYSATGGLGGRTARVLQGFPPMTGSRDEWPLSDHFLAQLAATERFRKKIRSFSVLCRILMIVAIVIAAVLAFGMMVIVSQTRGRGGAEVAMIFLGTIALLGGYAVLCFFVSRTVMKCRLWGPITQIVLWSLYLLIMFVQAAIVMSSRFGPGAEMLIPVVFYVVICGIFIYMAVAALSAIPKFLACPVWTQEALVNAKL